MNLSTSFHDNRRSSDQVGGLLTNFGVFVAQSPQDGTTDLWQVGFGTCTECIDDCSETVQHDHVLEIEMCIALELFIQ